MNVRYLHRNTFTDIISFDYSEHEFLSADIFISIDRVKENALKYEIEFDEELRRVMIHGILHLSGFSDKAKNQKSKMQKAENESLEIWHAKFHVKH
jgi:probable rRNA maturation factor